MRKKLFLSSILALSIGFFSSNLLFGCGIPGIFGCSDKTTKTTFSIEGMTCKKCVSKIKSALKEIEGVKKVKISLKDKQATVKYDKDKVTIEELIKAVEKAGFKAELPNIKSIALDIKGMTCPSCAPKVKSAIRKVSGVKKVEVSLENGKAIVEFEKAEVSVSQLIEAVNKAGFQAESAK